MPLSNTYIRREQIIVEITRFNKKYKDKYRFKAKAYAPLGYIDDDVDHHRLFVGPEVYSKTEHGARVSAIQGLLRKCRPPLTKEQKRINDERYKNGDKDTLIKRSVYVEVRVSNSLDFIMNDDEVVWHEIRKES